MTQILFCHGAADRLQTAARWLERALSCATPTRPIILYAPDEASANHIDHRLWAEPPNGFLPHCRVHAPHAAETPILIACPPAPLPQGQQLLNLSNLPPPGYQDFPSLIEIVSQEDEVRLPARQRAKTYRDAGHEVRFRDLQKDPL